MKMEYIILIASILLVIFGIFKVEDAENKLDLATESLEKANRIYMDIQGVKIDQLAKIKRIENKPRFSLEEISLLSRLIYAEANLEPIDGKIAIIEVIKQRMKNQNMTLREVIYQPGQFDGINSKNFNYTSKECIKAIELYEAGTRAIGEGHIWYINPDIATDNKFIEWLDSECIGTRIGNHIFYKQKEVEK